MPVIFVDLTKLDWPGRANDKNCSDNILSDFWTKNINTRKNSTPNKKHRAFTTCIPNIVYVAL